MQASDIPVKLPIRFAEDAAGGYIRAIPTASQIGITDGAASLHDGFVPLNATPIESGGVPPSIKDMNGILYEISGWSRWVAAGGTVTFDADFCTLIGGYPAGAVLMSASAPGVLYMSEIDNNTASPEGGGVPNWLALLPVPATIADLVTGTDVVKYTTAAALAGLRATQAQVLAGVDPARFLTPLSFYQSRAAKADIQTGTDDHKYLTALGLAQSFTGDAQTILLPGGRIIKVGSLVLPTPNTSTTSRALVFATPFPNTAGGILLTGSIGPNPDYGGLTLKGQSLTVNGAFISGDTGNAEYGFNVAVTVYFLAWGT